jgi:hypothetical protein
MARRKAGRFVRIPVFAEALSYDRNVMSRIEESRGVLSSALLVASLSSVYEPRRREASQECVRSSSTFRKRPKEHSGNFIFTVFRTSQQLRL